jgi:signal transduction histidine kinase
MGGARPVAARERARVLLVDDKPGNLLALTAVLEQLDVEPVGVGSGEEALRRLLAEEFALIVLDVQMPGLDGFETARLIKQREKTRYIPIIFLTAISGAPEHYLRGYGLGAVDYVYKPFAPDILRAKVGVFLELWQRGALIERQRGELERRLGELDRAHEALARQANDLERSNAALQRFAEVAAHELQAPLHNAAGFLDLLLARHRDALDDEATLLAERAARGVTEMRALTGRLLDYAKAATDTLATEQVALSEVLEAARRDLAEPLGAAGATVLADHLPTVPGDRRMLICLFVNLLDNAVKFRGKAAPAIRVSADPAPGVWQVTVRDNGVGIDPHEVPRLFTVFARLPPTANRPGHGVGLATCRRIVERHGGAIWCEPAPAEEDGALFRFVLPSGTEGPAAGAGTGEGAEVEVEVEDPR